MRLHLGDVIGHLQDDSILILRPESFRVFLSCANKGFCYSNLAGITKFKYERETKRILVDACNRVL